MSAVLNSPVTRFRAMLESDIDKVLEVEHSAYDYPWTAAIFVDCLSVGYHCAVLESESHIIGFVVVSAAVGEAHLLNLCVDENHRGLGHGSELLHYALKIASDLGCRDIFLEVRPSNKAALRLYRRRGFRSIGTRPNYYRALGGREDAFVMTTSLDPADHSSVFVALPSDCVQFKH